MTTRRAGWLLVALSVGAVLLGGFSYAARDADTPEPSEASLPTPFLIARMPWTLAGMDAVIYNPVSGRYVVFLRVAYSLKLSRLFTRVYKPDGTPASGLRMACEITSAIISVDVAYNAKDDRFLVVASYGNDKTMYDGIKAGVLDGQGRLVANQPFIEIKEQTGPFTGLMPQAVWIAETDQYAVSWNSWSYLKPTDPSNGHYLAVLNADLSFKIRGRQVRQQAVLREEPFIASICPVGGRLLWGSAEMVGSSWVKPVAWFTDLKGKVLTDYGYDGILSPGPMVKAGGAVAAAGNPDQDRILLHWNVADNIQMNKQTFAKNFFRIMDEEGAFVSAPKALPKTSAFQPPGAAVFNSGEGRFFVVAPEYRVVSHGSLGSYGMKLRGFYVDAQGRIEDKAGNDRIIGYDLTKAVLDPHKSSVLEALAYDPGTSSYFIGYGIGDEYAKTVDFMGIIYK